MGPRGRNIYNLGIFGSECQPNRDRSTVAAILPPRPDGSPEENLNFTWMRGLRRRQRPYGFQDGRILYDYVGPRSRLGSEPAGAFHLEPRNTAARNHYRRDAQREGLHQRHLQPMPEVRIAGVLR